MNVQTLFDLTGRVALITGGAGFLGRQHASALAEANCKKVILWDISSKALQRAAEELNALYPDKIAIREVNITDPQNVRTAVDEVRKAHGSLEVLVNNAGMTVAQGEEKFRKYFDPFESYPLELWEMALQVNLTGTFLVTQALAPLLKVSGKSSVINMASDIGVISPDHRIYRPNPERAFEGVPFNSPLSYATSKAALIQMTKYWATYWARDGIRSNAISPAGVENNQDKKFQRELVDRIPMGRMAKPYELKGAIVYLASDASSFMTGHNLVVDGGRTIW